MIVTWLSANLCIIWPSWLTYLLPACRRLLAGWILGDLSSTDLGAAAGFLWLQYHWPLHLWFCSFAANLLHRHQHTRTLEFCFSCADAHVHLDSGNPLLLLYPQINSENLLCSTNEKGFFNLLLTYDCCLNLYGSCIFMYVKTSAKEMITLTKGAAVLDASLAPMLNPFIYTLWNQQVKQANRYKPCLWRVQFSFCFNLKIAEYFHINEISIIFTKNFKSLFLTVNRFVR